MTYLIGKKEYNKKRHLRDREKNIKRATDWNRNNKERRKEIKDKWIKNNRDKVNFLKRQYMYRRKQTIRGLKVTYSYPSISEIADLYKKHLDLCVYCNLNKATTIDHVIPLSRGGTTELSNLLPACVSCNSSKRDKLLHEWKPELYDKK
jgi:5-methylcytosine-specific restriction endonuclease McrA